MVNTLELANNDLVPVDYLEIMGAILQAVQQKQTLFNIKENEGRSRVDIEKIAHDVARQQLANPLQGSEVGVRAATVNFSPQCRQRFPNIIREIRKALREQLEASLKNSDLTITEFVSSLLQDLESFKNPKPALDLSYPFSSYNLQKQRLSIQDPGGNSGALKFHKLTITISHIQDFDRELKAELQRYIDEQLKPDDEEDHNDLNDILQDLVESQNSDFGRLKRLVDTEVLGQLKKEAKIRYLEYLAEKINANNHPDVIYLQDLIRRLKLINAYISDPNKSDGDYEVTYEGVTVNLRQQLSRAEAFDALPVIPIIEGYLGETTDNKKGLRQFIWGLKLKFNGPVPTHESQSVFDYHLNLIDPDSQEYQEGLQNANTTGSTFFIEKVLRVTFLYFFVFTSRCDPSSQGYELSQELAYDPRANFEKKFLPTLKNGDDAEKQNLLRNLKKGFEKFKVKVKLQKLVNVLKEYLKQKTVIPRHESSLHIGVLKKILETDIETILKSETLFKSVIHKTKDSLQYISVGQASVNSEFLCQLPVSLEIEDIRYANQGDRESFSMAYDIQGLKALPVAMLSKEVLTSKTNKTYENNFTKRKLLVFYCDLQTNNNMTNQQAFIYRFTFSLLFYICLKILADNTPNKHQLFIPLIRLHLGDKQNPHPLEEFMRNLSIFVSHLLNEEEYLASSQGFDIKSTNTYKTTNGLSSLYSGITKTFSLQENIQIPQLDRLAIIVVSSRESDAQYSQDKKQRISNLIGEVVTVNHLANNDIKLQPLQTFSDNYSIQQMYSQPLILHDIVSQLYQKGYRHFLYIAKAPYTSTLNMTLEEESDDRLFFMSRALIRYLKTTYRDIKLYPIFYDKYYARELESIKAKSLYIQDTAELTRLLDDPSKQAAVFFNLFNGIKVGKPNDRFYHGVISYATLLNIYPKILDDEDIRQGLIYEGSLKNDILLYLTLFHFSRYESSYRMNLKLDPYQRIIGDDSVGKLSLFPHMQGKAVFNSLAFLTEVKKALNVPDSKFPGSGQ